MIIVIDIIPEKSCTMSACESFEIRSYTLYNIICMTHNVCIRYTYIVTAVIRGFDSLPSRYNTMHVEPLGRSLGLGSRVSVVAVVWRGCNGGSSEGLLLIPIYTIRDVLGRTTARHIVAAKYEMSIYINFSSHCMRESSARTQGIQKLTPYHPPLGCGRVKMSRGKQYGWIIYIYIHTLHYTQPARWQEE